MQRLKAAMVVMMQENHGNDLVVRSTEAGIKTTLTTSLLVAVPTRVILPLRESEGGGNTSVVTVMKRRRNGRNPPADITENPGKRARNIEVDTDARKLPMSKSQAAALTWTSFDDDALNGKKQNGGDKRRSSASTPTTAAAAIDI